MSNKTMPKIIRRSRKQRLKAAAMPDPATIVSAAVSISEPLYLQALSAAQRRAEGNFSRYVRGLITQDLQKAS
jgi:hypothetical protein